MGKQFKILYFLMILTFVSCKEEDNPNEVAIDGQLESETLIKLSEIGSASSSIWDGYDLVTTHPIYLIFNDNSGLPGIGYILNNSNPPDGSIRVTASDSHGLVVFRNDNYIDEFKDLGSYAFQILIENEEHFMAKQIEINSPYLIYSNTDNNYLPVLLTHELFHYYQFFVDGWDLSQLKQDFFGYPNTKEIVELSLLLFDRMADAYTNPSLDYLKEYYVIRNEQISLDPSADELVTHQGTYTEMVEGSARYVEFFSAQNSIFPTIGIDPTYSWKNQLDTVTTADLARHILVQRINYHVGAIVIKILVDNGVDVTTAFKNGITPFELAGTLLNISETEKAQVLQALKASVNWTVYQNWAVELESLLN